MPQLLDEASPVGSLEDLVRQPKPWSSTEDDGQYQPACAPISDTESPNDLSSYQPDSTATVYRRTSAEPRQNAVETSLFPDASGKLHYVGPTGTLSFLAQLRQLFLASLTAVSPLNSAVIPGSEHVESAETLEADDETQDSRQPGVHVPGATDYAMTIASPSPTCSSAPSDFSHSYGGDFSHNIAELPPDGIAELLIHSYFKTVHGDFPLFDRQTFENQYEIYISLPRHKPQSERPWILDWGWIGCLYMVMLFGSLCNPHIKGVDHVRLRKRCIANTRALLPRLVSKCTLSNISALILVSFHLHNNSERNTAWNLTGVAIRMSFALGLHQRQAHAPRSSLDQPEVLVLHALYGFEAFLSSSLGRPCGVHLIPFPSSRGLSGGASVVDQQWLSASISLGNILAQTGQQTVSGKMSPCSGKSTAVGTLEILRLWKEDLAKYEHLDLPIISMESVVPVDCEFAVEFSELETRLSRMPRAQLRATLLLHIRFHYIAIMSTRDHLLLYIASAHGDTQAGVTSNTCSIAHACVYHAQQLAFVFLLLDSAQLLHGVTGLDIFYGYWAGMILNLLLLRRSPTDDTRPRSQREPWTCGGMRYLVTRVHFAIERAEKSSTMERLFKVMVRFVHWARLSDESIDFLALARPASEHPPAWIAHNQERLGDVLFQNEAGHPNAHLDSGLPKQANPGEGPRQGRDADISEDIELWHNMWTLPYFVTGGAGL